jgi:hypothetical protein
MKVLDADAAMDAASKIVQFALWALIKKGANLGLRSKAKRREEGILGGGGG